MIVGSIFELVLTSRPKMGRREELSGRDRRDVERVEGLYPLREEEIRLVMLPLVIQGHAQRSGVHHREKAGGVVALRPR